MSRGRFPTTALLITLLALPACSTNQSTDYRNSVPRAVPEGPGPAREHIAAGGQAAVLGSLSANAISPDDLDSRVSERLREGRYRSALETIRRNADTARKLILQSNPSDRNDPALRFTGAALDQLATYDRTGAWTDTLQWLTSSSPESEQFRHQQARLRSLLQSGEFQQATSIDLTAILSPSAPSPLFSEAARLEAIPLIMTEQDRPAAAILDRAFTRAITKDSISAPQLGLLTSEAAARAGETSLARDTWEQAASALLANTERGIPSPSALLRLSEIKPADARWPDATQTMLTEISGINAGFDATLHAAIGQWLMEHQAYPAALVEFKQAETQSADRRTAEQLRIEQARCLIAMRQEPAAASVLSSLSTSQDDIIAGQARAILALQQLRIGRGTEALALLQSAAALLEGTKHASDVAADLGLACLTLEQEDRGLALLQQALIEFERSAQWDDWLRVQQNLAIYYTETGNSNALRQTRQRIAEFEQSSPPARLD